MATPWDDDAGGGADAWAASGGLSSVLDAPSTPARAARRVTNVDLREELAAATAAIKDQKWVKALAQRVARRGDRDADEQLDELLDEGAEEAAEGSAASPAHAREPSREGNSPVAAERRRRDSLGGGGGSLPTTPKAASGTPKAVAMAAPSVLVPQATDDMLATLDPRFFTKSFDAGAYVLENLPTTREEIDEYLQTEISAVDVAKDVIVAKLADDVRENHDAFIQGMKLVQDVDLDLVRAQIHVKNARRLVLSTKNDLVKGSLEIVKTKRNRDRVVSIIDLGSRIVRCFEEEERMNEALQKHAFTTAVDICLALRREVGVADLQGVTILKKLIHRVQHFLPELRSQFDKSLRQVAEQFDPLRYKELLQAYITLADHAENLGFEFSARHLSEVLSSIPEIIVRCIDELSRQLLTELFGDRTSPKKQKAASTGGSTVRPSSNLAGSTQSMTHTIEKVQRAYERLTSFMHTYYLLVQWHRDPFNPNNDDLAYLHRCGIDDDDDDDEDEGEDDDDEQDDKEYRNSEERGVLSPTSGQRRSLFSPRRRRSSSISSEPTSSQRSPYSDVLCETGMTLLRYRKVVWETMQQNVAEVLERLDTTYGFKLEHIITLSQTTFAFIDVGEEFTGSPSTKLRSMIRLKCEQYIVSFHDDNLELLRMLIDTESWQRILSVTSTVHNFQGMLRLVEKRSGYRFDDSSSSPPNSSGHGGAAIHERNVFPSFLANGNPFAAANAAQWFSYKPDKSVNDDRGGDSDGDDKAPEPESPELDGAGEQTDEEFVLTSSSLSGFVRMCGIYLKMMHYLPHVAWDVFLLLVKLLEFNLFAGFVSFVEPAHAQLLFHAQLPDAPVWGVLRANVARIAGEFHSGEVVLRSYVASTATSTSSSSDIVTLRRVTRLPGAMEQAGEANSFAFAERAVAAASVCSQTMLLRALRPLVRAHVADRYAPLIDEVYTRCEQSARQLRALVYSAFARVALAAGPNTNADVDTDHDGGSIAAMVARVPWGEVTYLRERPNDYVVHLVRKCGEVWGGMQIYSDGAIPVGARDDAWGALVQHVMDALLAAFAGVAACTPQGRALMSMDLLALQNGLDLINHVSRRRVPRGCEHVNTYIKAFYLSEEAELLEWVRRHRGDYSKAALASLIRHGVGSALPKKELRELVLRIDAILAAP